MANITNFRARPRDVLSETAARGSRFIPSDEVISRFTLPGGMSRCDVFRIKELADVLPLSAFGVTIPECVAYPDRFEQGFRHGLKTNRKTDPKNHFRESFAWGFVVAKFYYKRFAPKHSLAVPGSFSVKG